MPDRLARHHHIDQADVVQTRRLELNGSSRINGRRMDLGRIDQTVTVGTTEVWEVANRSGNPHNFHVHGIQFNIASYLGGPPPPRLAGWKDTVFLPQAAPCGCWSGSPATATRPCRTCSTATCSSMRTAG